MTDNTKGLELLTDLERMLILKFRQMDSSQKADFLKELKRRAEESNKRKGAED